MKLFLPLLLLLFASCSEKKQDANISEKSAPPNHITTPVFQSILDSAEVKGAILIYNPQENKYYSNDFTWANKGQLPASTYKIPNSIIALETGVVESDTTLFIWDGEDRALENWEQDLTFKQAFHYSCVPCYQAVAREIGVDSMREQIGKLNYGNIDVDSTTIDNFWLRGTSRITQFQQIDFLERLYKSQLPISSRTVTIMKSMMIIESRDGYVLSGKTGWSNQDGIDNGWYVGHLITDNDEWYFATNVIPKEGFDMSKFPAVRKKVTHKALDIVMNKK